MKFLPLFLIFLSSLLLEIGLAPVRGKFGMIVCSVIGFSTYFLLTYFSIRKFEKKLFAGKIALALLVGLLVVQLPLRIAFFKPTLLSLPDFLLHIFGILTAFYFLKLKKPYNLAFASACFVVVVFVFFQGYDLWLHKLNFGNFTSAISFKLPEKFEGVLQNKTIITNNDLKDKIVVLDFWYSKCGVCFEKFPQLERLYKENQNNPNIMILAVNTPIEEDQPNTAYDLIKNEGYGFPVVVTDPALAEKYEISAYPTTFVIDRTGLIVYKGDIENAVKKVNELRQQ